MQISVGQASYRDDAWGESKNQTIVYFEDRPVPDGPKSKEQGHPCFKNRTFIIKITPGDRLLRVERPMRDEDKAEFPKQWEAYEKKQANTHTGWLLEQWPILTTIQVMEMKAQNIFTVEQLANISDAHTQKFMGAQIFRQKARDALKMAKDDSYVVNLKERLEKAEATIAELTKPKKGGRPKKVADGANTPATG